MATKKSGPVAAITRKIGPLPLWAWFGLGIVVYYVFLRGKLGGSSTADTSSASSSGNPTPDASTGAAGVGADSGSGTADNMSSDLLSALLQQQAQSQQALVDALNAAYSQSQYYATGYGGYAGAPPGSISTGGIASSPSFGSPVMSADLSGNPAASFYPAGSGYAAGGPAPLYAYSAGRPIAESPVAGSVFSVYRPAASGYEALGVSPSSPVTFAPGPIGTPTVQPQLTAGRVIGV